MNVKLLPTAWDGLTNIMVRVRAQFGETVAQRVADEILSSLERLEQFPDTGVLTPDPWLNDMGFRMVVAGKRNVCIYRRFEDELLVYLIADTRMEYTRIFRDMI